MRGKMGLLTKDIQKVLDKTRSYCVGSTLMHPIHPYLVKWMAEWAD
jgi:hypothetical protein